MYSQDFVVKLKNIQCSCQHHPQPLHIESLPNSLKTEEIIENQNKDEADKNKNENDDKVRKEDKKGKKKTRRTKPMRNRKSRTNPKGVMTKKMT